MCLLHVSISVQISLSGLFQFMVRQSAMVESFMTSFERLHAYADWPLTSGFGWVWITSTSVKYAMRIFMGSYDLILFYMICDGFYLMLNVDVIRVRVFPNKSGFQCAWLSKGRLRKRSLSSSLISSSGSRLPPARD